MLCSDWCGSLFSSPPNPPPIGWKQVSSVLIGVSLVFLLSPCLVIGGRLVSSALIGGSLFPLSPLPFDWWEAGMLCCDW